VCLRVCVRVCVCMCACVNVCVACVCVTSSASRNLMNDSWASSAISIVAMGTITSSAVSVANPASLKWCKHGKRKDKRDIK